MPKASPETKSAGTTSNSITKPAANGNSKPTKAPATKTKIKDADTKKIFVLDTSVILYDHSAIRNFQEHDVAIPITVLEELDNFKKGNDIKNFEAREFIRFIDKLSSENRLQDWIPLNGRNKGSFKVLMNNATTGVDAVNIFGEE